MNSADQPLPFLHFLSPASFLNANRLAESAWTAHVPFSFWLVEQLKPKLFVELGVHNGVSYFAICQSIKFNQLSTLCYGVDTWQGDPHAGHYEDAVWTDASDYNQQTYGAFSYLLKATFDEALPYFEAGSINLLHIDGFHSYEAVKQDFESWLPRMAADGVILFHDIVVREREFGVYKFWNEIKQQYKHFEFLHGYGLGVLALGSASSEHLNQLFSLSTESEITNVQSLYANLGAWQASRYNMATLQQQLSGITGQFAMLQTQYNALLNEHELLKKFLADGESNNSPETGGATPPIPADNS